MHYAGTTWRGSLGGDQPVISATIHMQCGSRKGVTGECQEHFDLDLGYNSPEPTNTALARRSGSSHLPVHCTSTPNTTGARAPPVCPNVFINADTVPAKSSPTSIVTAHATRGGSRDPRKNHPSPAPDGGVDGILDVDAGDSRYREPRGSRMKTVYASVCPLDCPDTCSLSVAVEDDRIVEVRGSKANPYTAGVICTKVARDFPAIANGEGRLLMPLRRVGPKGAGRFELISWGEALDIIHDRFTAVIAGHGPQAILPLNYAGPHGMLAYASMDLRFFHKLGATLLDRKPLCGGIRTEAWLGTFGAVAGIPPEQVALSKLIIAWGNNVTWSNLHLTPVINQARRNGSKLVVVDPKRIKVAERADLHLALRPGTDVVLAWALTNELERRGAFDRSFIERHVEGFEAYMERVRRITLPDAERITGVPRAQIQTLAEWYHTLSPAAISVGNGLERNQNGGSGIRAIFALPALAGKLGMPGGGLVNGASFAFPKTPARLQRPDLVPPGTRTLNIVDVGAHLLDPTLSPPIKAVFIYNHNPVIVHPDQNRMRRGLLR